VDSATSDGEGHGRDAGAPGRITRFQERDLTQVSKSIDSIHRTENLEKLRVFSCAASSKFRKPQVLLFPLKLSILLILSLCSCLVSEKLP
jgi:hypothetical protein